MKEINLFLEREKMIIVFLTFKNGLMPTSQS